MALLASDSALLAQNASDVDFAVVSLMTMIRQSPV
jgi:hypothetical protein